MSKFSIGVGLVCLVLVSGIAVLGGSAALIEDDSAYYDQRCVVSAKFYEGPDNYLELCRKNKVYLTENIWFSPDLLGVRDVMNSVRAIFTKPFGTDPVIQAAEAQTQGGGDAEPEENPDDEVLLWSDDNWEVYKAEKSALCYAQSGAVALSFPMPGSLIAGIDPTIVIHVPPEKSEKLGLRDGSRPLVSFVFERGISNDFSTMHGSVSVRENNTVVTVALSPDKDKYGIFEAPVEYFFSNIHGVTIKISPDGNPELFEFLHHHSMNGGETGEGMTVQIALFSCVQDLTDQ